MPEFRLGLELLDTGGPLVVEAGLLGVTGCRIELPEQYQRLAVRGVQSNGFFQKGPLLFAAGFPGSSQAGFELEQAFAVGIREFGFEGGPDPLPPAASWFRKGSSAPCRRYPSAAGSTNRRPKRSPSCRMGRCHAPSP